MQKVDKKVKVKLGLQMRKTGSKLCGGTNMPVVRKITAKYEFCDAEEQLEFYIVKTED